MVGVLTFRRNILIPSSGSKIKPSKEATSRVIDTCLHLLYFNLKGGGSRFLSKVGKYLPDFTA
jgi:hypothetical protein